MDDSEIIRAFQAGDTTAFDLLVERYRLVVYRVARRILKNHEEADDATQEAFVKAYRGLAAFKGESSFKTWIHRIAMNAAFDLQARERTQSKAWDDAARETAASNSARPDGPRALKQILRDEEFATLRAAVARLPERQRLTLTLRVQDDLKYTEIAEALGCPVGTVKANFHHAVTNLRRLLAEETARTDAQARSRRTQPAHEAADGTELTT